MRVLGLTHQYPRPGNPLFAPYNRHQLRWLSLRHDVRVVAPVAWTHWLGRKAFRQLSGGRPYQNLDGVWVRHPPYFYFPRVLEHHYGTMFLRSAARSVRDEVESFRPHVIFSSWSHPDGWAAVRLGREFGLPVLVKVIGSDVLVLGRDPKRKARVAEALCGADSVVAVSQDLAKHVVKLGADPRRVHVVPEGIDFDLFWPGDRAEARAALGLEPVGSASPPRLLFVGNLLLSKGAGVLLEACGLLRRRGIEFRCHLVGRGRDEPRLRELAARLKLQDWVDFAGPKPQAQLPDWYRASDLVVLPSFSEGIPNVLREAMMCGRRFVATRVGGIPEITRESVGRLVEAGQVEQLAEAIAAELSNGPPPDAAREDALALNVTWERSAELLAEKLVGILPKPHDSTTNAR